MKRLIDALRFKEKGSSDFVVTALVTILVIFGVVMVFSASYYKSINTFGTPYVYLRKQMIFAILGFVIMYVVSRIDYHFWGAIAKPLLFVTFLLLVLVLIGFGSSENNATRALYIGITIMPGEIAKVTTFIYAANFLSRKNKIMESFKNGILPLALITGMIAFLIILQPNLSTALTVCGIVAGMMFIGGLQWRYVVSVLILAGLGVFGLMTFGGLIGGAHWKRRIMGFWSPFEDALGDFFQVCQGLLAFGSGGLTGVGLGKSVQKTMYLPEPQNDFILPIIGEELGLIGVLILIAVFLLLIWRCFSIAINAKDRFGMYLASGVTLMIALQLIFNVAVVTSSMPPTGVVLPFISYGGNALWLFMGSMGMLLSVSRQSSIEKL